jgi:hypothetical protein
MNAGVLHRDSYQRHDNKQRPDPGYPFGNELPDISPTSIEAPRGQHHQEAADDEEQINAHTHRQQYVIGDCFPQRRIQKNTTAVNHHDHERRDAS